MNAIVFQVVFQGELFPQYFPAQAALRHFEAAKLRILLHNSQKWVMIYHIPRRVTSAAALKLLEFAHDASSYITWQRCS